ncbi:MAG TPA: hypothetical protein VH253_18535 [Phycisphaerae bacterium]|nr:hypothetical protein [Phycisphaerae bacterium]
MTTMSSGLHIEGLKKRELAALSRKARRFKMTPEEYVHALVREDLAISGAAKRTSFAAILEPGREVDEEELDRLVERAREEHHRKSGRRKR